MKPILLLAGFVLAALAGLRAGRRLAGGPRGDPGVEANARLTGYAADGAWSTAATPRLPVGVHACT